MDQVKNSLVLLLLADSYVPVSNQAPAPALLSVPAILQLGVAPRSGLVSSVQHTFLRSSPVGHPLPGSLAPRPQLLLPGESLPMHGEFMYSILWASALPPGRSVYKESTKLQVLLLPLCL